MIYQNIKELTSSNEPVTSKFIKQEIDKYITTVDNPMPQLVEDLILSYLENNSNDHIKDAISKGFYHLFVNGLTWLNCKISKYQPNQVTKKKKN